ncbi:MAG TPA: hypothetical protein PKX93_04395 [bacterium]|nr:hypothetical protein [bacterium]
MKINLKSIFGLLTIVIMTSLPALSQQVTGARDLPSFYNPGSTMTVLINLAVDETNPPGGLIVAETPPSGWAILSATPPYESATGGTYRWVFYGGEVIDRTITYTVNIPPTSGGQQTFSGKVEYLDPAGALVSEDISGDTTTISTPLPLLSVSPATLDFGTSTTFLPFTITNVGGADLVWQASVTQAWLTLTRTSGTLTSGQHEVVTANVNRTGLTSGTHTANINFTSNGGNSSVAVVLVVGSPSPVSNLQVLSSLAGVDLYWSNPAGYTGTIIFRKVGQPITGGPQNGSYYEVGESAGDALCIFKDVDGNTHYYDGSLTPGTTYYYQVYSFSDLNYSTPSSGSASPASVADFWLNVDPATGLDVISQAQGPVNGFGIDIPPGALQSPANLQLGSVSPDQAPAHSNLLQGFASIYLLLSDINLLPGQAITLRIPVYQQDLNAAGVRKLSELRVYHWPGPGNQWEELTVTSRQTLEIGDLKGFITVLWNNITGHDYFSLGSLVPQGSSGGGCFIATAAFGSSLASQISLLRLFRDEVLLKHRPGQAFVAWYYRHGPQAANYLNRHTCLKPLVRWLLYPVIGFAWLVLKGIFWPLVLLLSVGLLAMIILQKGKNYFLR